MSTFTKPDPVTDTRLPRWLRIVAYAEAHADDTGRCALHAEELHRAVDPTTSKKNISLAIAIAKRRGLITADSDARLLVLASQSADLAEAS